MLLSILLRSLVLLRQTIATLICAAFLLGALMLLLPFAPAAARPVANVPTASPAPPTAEPPTAVPPAPEPPPLTATTPPRRERREKPTATAAPPTATSATEPSPTAPPSAEVLIAKSVNADQISRGDTALYSIRVSNTGGSLARDVVVSDDVPAALEVIDLQSGKGNIVVSGQHVTAYPSTLEPGEAATLLVRVRVRPAAPAGLLVNLAQVTTSSPGDDPGNNSDTARMTVVVPAAAPAPAQRLPRTAESAVGPALPWWLPWLVVATGLMVFGAVLTYQVEPALQRMIAAQSATQPQSSPRSRPTGARVSRRPLAPPRPRRPIGRPARRPGQLRQAPGRAGVTEPVAVAAPRIPTTSPRDQLLREIDELERIRTSLVEQRLRLLRESLAPAPQKASSKRRR